ncbi:MAG TPA: hypothetical protein VFQ22_13175, partial [Longimicrobiales bacterium]|nr:hypothetical protein [Longimicrobiales bacterium]
PTEPPVAFTRPPWWREWMNAVHLGSAATLFVMFAVFALVLFPHTDPKKKRTTFRKRLADGRNRTYYACGVVILVAIAVAAWFHQTGRDIFWPEAVAIGAFAVSWLVKGRIGGLPGEAVDHVQDVGRKLRQKLGGEPPAATG